MTSVNEMNAYNRGKKDGKREAAHLLNKALNKHSKTIREGGLDYVAAFEEVEKLEKELFKE